MLVTFFNLHAGKELDLVVFVRELAIFHGGLLDVVKVFRMQQMDIVRLQKLLERWEVPGNAVIKFRSFAL